MSFNNSAQFSNYQDHSSQPIINGPYTADQPQYSLVAQQWLMPPQSPYGLIPSHWQPVTNGVPAYSHFFTSPAPWQSPQHDIAFPSSGPGQGYHVSANASTSSGFAHPEHRQYSSISTDRPSQPLPQTIPLSLGAEDDLLDDDDLLEVAYPVRQIACNNAFTPETRAVMRTIQMDRKQRSTGFFGAYKSLFCYYYNAAFGMACQFVNERTNLKPGVEPGFISKINYACDVWTQWANVWTQLANVSDTIVNESSMIRFSEFFNRQK
jgi:hypothetical protein